MGGCDGFFAAANSGTGFKNYYGEVFGDADRIFVVKGGPGTGKSRFIREVSDFAAARGWAAEYYYCSSDPESLDGVLLRRGGESAAVIDGTPPHAWEPSEPGLREETVNLGDFWNPSLLRERGEEIRALNKRKVKLWRDAYKWLSGCLDMCGVIKSASAGCADEEKIRALANEILESIPDGQGGGVRTAIACSVGMQGVVLSGEYIKRAERLYLVRDYYMSAYLLIGAVAQAAHLKKLGVIISYDPIDADRPDGILIEENKIAIVVANEPPAREFIPIYMEEMCEVLEDAAKKSADHAERCREAMLSGALEALGEVKKCHFALEEIYIGAMDFSAKERFTQEFCIKNFGV